MSAPTAIPNSDFAEGQFGTAIWGGFQNQSLQFMDETGLNPLPAGILVTLYDGTAGGPIGPLPPPGAVLGEGWTEPGGVCDIAVTPNTLYVATFTLSAQAPKVAIFFTPDGATQVYVVEVAPYRSVALSASGCAAFQMSKLPRKWFGQAAMTPGDGVSTPSGVAYAIGFGMASGLAALELQCEQNHSMMRLQSSLDGDIDSWSNDMVGPLFGRYVQESDQLFIARNELMVSRPRTTINAIQAIVVAFYNSILAGWNATGEEGLAFDRAGAFDISGGLDTAPAPKVPKNPPAVLVWDGMTMKVLAHELGIIAGQVVIQIGSFNISLLEQLGFDVAGGFNTQGAFTNDVTTDSFPPTTLIPPDPRLGTIINILAKAGGVQPVYLVGQY